MHYNPKFIENFKKNTYNKIGFQGSLGPGETFLNTLNLLYMYGVLFACVLLEGEKLFFIQEYVSM